MNKEVLRKIDSSLVPAGIRVYKPRTDIPAPLRVTIECRDMDEVSKVIGAIAAATNRQLVMVEYRDLEKTDPTEAARRLQAIGNLWGFEGVEELMARPEA
jgi:hypothetical protein